MIRFALSCVEGHRFEGWFSSSEGFETQREEGILVCPLCGTDAVTKALMAPAVATGRKRDAGRESGRDTGRVANPMAASTHVAAEPEAVALLRKVRKHLTENATYVGDKFAEEARRIHYDEAERRGIYGEATPDEARALADEGIEFHPLPVLPEEHN